VARPIVTVITSIKIVARLPAITILATDHCPADTCGKLATSSPNLSWCAVDARVP
jgi:hypothetical protein